MTTIFLMLNYFLFTFFSISFCYGSGANLIDIIVDLLLAAGTVLSVYLCFSIFLERKESLDLKEDEMLGALNELQDLMGKHMSPATPFNEWSGLPLDSKIQELKGLQAGIEEVHRCFSHLVPNYSSIKEQIESIFCILSDMQVLSIKF